MSLIEDVLNPRCMSDFENQFVIAGGCLRDTFFDKEAKDVDMFVWVSGQSFKLIKENREFSLVAEDPRMYVDYPMYISAHCHYDDELDFQFKVEGDPEYEEADFLSGRCENAPGLNIILLNKDERPYDIDALIKTFPCSISQIAYDVMSDTVYVTDKFKKTLETKEVWFASGVEQKYKDKIFPKYSDMFEEEKWITYKIPYTLPSGILRGKTAVTFARA